MVKMNTDDYPILNSVTTPADLRLLDEDQLPQAAEELRRYLIQSVATSGGHFGAGLGCVELTIALHYLYDTPRDRIVWDVGHQAYPTKFCAGVQAALPPSRKSRDSRLSPSDRKVNTTPSAQAIHPRRSALRSAWPSLQPAGIRIVNAWL